MIDLAQKDVARFWNKVDASRGFFECWLWTGYRDRGGYGRVRIKRHTYVASRISWIVTSGEIPAGLLVCHRCDNPGCVNPAHLFLGTQLANMADMDQKGRRRVSDRRGENNPNHKLSAAQAAEIRGLYAAGDVSYRELGRIFGVAKSSVKDVVKMRHWALPCSPSVSIGGSQ